MTEKTCRRCGCAKPADRYHFKPTRQGNPSNTCRECVSREARERYAEKRKAEIAALPPIEVATEHRCAMCGETKPWTPEFFPRQKGAPRGVGYRCKACRSKEQRARYERNPEPVRERVRARYALMASTPEGRALLNAQANARNQRWRRANPDAVRNAERRWREKVRERERENPALRAERIELARLDARMRAEREGREPRAFRSALNAYRAAVGNVVDAYPAEPMGVWVDALLRREVPDRGRPFGDAKASRDDRSRTIADLCAELGVEDRVLTRIEHRTYKTVTLGVADRLLRRYGPLYIDAERVEARLAELAAYWQSAPGNGERLIGYLTDADRIAHLAGAVVDCVEDLWPALEGPR